MINQQALVVLVKTPGLNPVKTRLAIGLGKEKAEEFYLLSVRAVESILKETERKKVGFSLFWAVAEPEGVEDPLWQSFQTIFQGEGGFGERLHHVYSSLLKKYQSVIIIGADSPQLSSSYLEKAAAILKEEERFVIGPALDGGFYLFGGNIPIPKQVWTETSYSQDTTLAQLREKLRADEKVVLLEKTQDVDNLEDLIALRDRFPSSCTPEQKRLRDWINNLKI
jgi:rSAM/selenodomain-associated transferase 1